MAAGLDGASVGVAERVGVAELSVGVVLGEEAGLWDAEADDVLWDCSPGELSPPAEPSGSGARTPSGRPLSRAGLSYEKRPPTKAPVSRTARAAPAPVIRRVRCLRRDAGRAGSGSDVAVGEGRGTGRRAGAGVGVSSGFPEGAGSPDAAESPPSSTNGRTRQGRSVRSRVAHV